MFALNKCIIFRRCGSHFSCSVNITAFQFRTFFCYFLRLTSRQRMKRDRENEYKIQCERNIKGMPYVTAQCEETICCTAHLNRFFYIVKISCTSIENFTKFNMSIHKRFTCTQQAKYRKIDGKKKNESKMERYTYFEIERRFFWDPMNERNKEISLLYRKKYNNVCVRCVFFFNSPLIK